MMKDEDVHIFILERPLILLRGSRFGYNIQSDPYRLFRIPFWKGNKNFLSIISL